MRHGEYREASTSKTRILGGVLASKMCSTVDRKPTDEYERDKAAVDR